MSGKVTRHSAVIFMTRVCQIKMMNHLYCIYLIKGKFCTSAAPTHTHFGMHYLLILKKGGGLGLQYTLAERGAERKKKEQEVLLFCLLLSPAFKYDPTSLILQTNKKTQLCLDCTLLSLHPFLPLTHMPQSSIRFAHKLHNACTTLPREPPDMFPGVSPVFLSMAQCSCGYSFPPFISSIMFWVLTSPCGDIFSILSSLDIWCSVPMPSA